MHCHDGTQRSAATGLSRAAVAETLQEAVSSGYAAKNCKGMVQR